MIQIQWNLAKKKDEFIFIFFFVGLLLVPRPLPPSPPPTSSWRSKKKVQLIRIWWWWWMNWWINRINIWQRVDKKKLSIRNKINFACPLWWSWFIHNLFIFLRLSLPFPPARPPPLWCCTDFSYVPNDRNDLYRVVDSSSSSSSSFPFLSCPSHTSCSAVCPLVD